MLQQQQGHKGFRLNKKPQGIPISKLALKEVLELLQIATIQYFQWIHNINMGIDTDEYV